MSDVTEQEWKLLRYVYDDFACEEPGNHTAILMGAREAVLKEYSNGRVAAGEAADVLDLRDSAASWSLSAMLAFRCRNRPRARSRSRQLLLPACPARTGKKRLSSVKLRQNEEARHLGGLHCSGYSSLKRFSISRLRIAWIFQQR